MPLLVKVAITCLLAIVAGSVIRYYNSDDVGGAGDTIGVALLLMGWFGFIACAVLAVWSN